MRFGARLAALFALTLFASAGVASAAPKTYQIDRTHSEVGFNIRHFFNKTHGRFERYAGTVVWDPENLTASSCEITIQDSSIYTANERRDSDLRGPNFFWVEKYPTITFKSTKVVAGKTKERFQVDGTLTIRDVTKPVTLDVEYLGMGNPAIEGNDMGTQAGFWATTKIDRKEFGIVWNKALDQGGTMLGDDVDIVLSVAAVAREPKPAPLPPPPAKK